MTTKALEISSPVGLIAAGGVMPFAVADSLAARGIKPVLFALKGACDPSGVARFRHHWISVGQLGRAMKLFRSENCRDIVHRAVDIGDFNRRAEAGDRGSRRGTIDIGRKVVLKMNRDLGLSDRTRPTGERNGCPAG